MPKKPRRSDPAGLFFSGNKAGLELPRAPDKMPMCWKHDVWRFTSARTGNAGASAL
jgi:hypothetical protein